VVFIRCRKPAVNGGAAAGFSFEPTERLSAEPLTKLEEGCITGAARASGLCRHEQTATAAAIATRLIPSVSVFCRLVILRFPFDGGLDAFHLGIDKDFHPATKAHPGLLVSDLQAIMERCREGGFVIVDDAPLEGYRRIFINDPFGNRLELMQKL
jgi:catechol 2,3-dioxygenase-like lactoylglutathione lyase family enzyme